MAYVPIPGIGYPDLSVPEKNWAHYIDALYLPGVLWQKTWDPEGILSTLPSIITGVIGMLFGYIITIKKNINDKLILIFVFGFILLFIGDSFRWLFPINKNIWSTSYTLLMGGISSLTLGFSIYLIDVLKYSKGLNFAQVFGVNSISHLKEIFCHYNKSPIHEVPKWGSALKPGLIDPRLWNKR